LTGPVTVTSGVEKVISWTGWADAGGLTTIVNNAGNDELQLLGVGLWICVLEIEWSVFAGSRYIQLDNNGAAPHNRDGQDTTPEGDIMVVSYLTRVVGPQIVSARVFQSSGANRTVTVFSLLRVARLNDAFGFAE